VISFDFSVAIVPGWHTTIFSAVFRSGGRHLFWLSAMVLRTIANSAAQGVWPLKDIHHYAAIWTNMAKVMLATGLIVAYGYFMGILHGLLQRATSLMFFLVQQALAWARTRRFLTTRCFFATS